MPMVRVTITDDDLSRAQKEEVVRRVTATLADVLGKNPATTHVTLERVPADEWAVGGELVDARRARGAVPTSAAAPLGQPLALTIGRGARDRRQEAKTPDPSGARAALETFYHAFNQRSIAVLEDVWADDASITLNNPVGGALTGIAAIKELYGRVFGGPARVWVEYHDIVEYIAGGHALFVGRERGSFEVRESEVRESEVTLAIRTSRYFRQLPHVGWRQVHHHGSIDDAALLAAYQSAVRDAKR